MTMNRGARELERWMETARLTQGEAASRCGIDSRYFYKIVKGHRKPGLEVAIRIRNATGVSVDAWGESEEAKKAS